MTHQVQAKSPYPCLVQRLSQGKGGGASDVVRSPVVNNLDAYLLSQQGAAQMDGGRGLIAAAPTGGHGIEGRERVGNDIGEGLVHAKCEGKSKRRRPPLAITD